MRSHDVAGMGRLVRLGVRTGWPGLLGGAVSGAALVAAVAFSIAGLYPTAADRVQYAATVGASAATEAFNGRGHALTTIGGITAYEVGFMGQLLFPLLALHWALRHTRRDEEAGRTELVTAGRVGRLAPLAAATVLVTTAAALTGVLILVGTVAAGLPVAGSTWYAAATVLLLLSFGGLGLLLAQLAQSTRTAYTVGVVVVTALFLVRAVVDGLGWRAVWASPLGWFAEVRPYGEPRGWPLVAYGGVALLLLVLALLVAHHRDLGAGVLAPRPGPDRARPVLGTVGGAAWRLTRSVALSWTAVAVVWAGVFGMLSREMTRLVEANPTILQALGVERASDVVTSMAVVIVCGAATAVTVQGSSRLGGEESSDRLGAWLASRVPRQRLWLTWWTVVAGSSLLVLAAGCASLGLATWASTGEQAAFATAMEVAAGYVTPVLFVGSVAAVLRAALPGVADAAWAVVGWLILVGFLAETLSLPEWARDLSPVHLVGDLPREDVDAAASVVLAAGTLLLLAVSVAAFRRRDLRPA
jgi:ABC-2 type transport system permease protein